MFFSNRETALSAENQYACYFIAVIYHYIFKNLRVEQMLSFVLPNIFAKFGFAFNLLCMKTEKTAACYSSGRPFVRLNGLFAVASAHRLSETVRGFSRAQR